MFSLGLYLIIEYYFFKILVTHDFIEKRRFARKAITIYWDDINKISYDLNSEKLFISNCSNTIVISVKHIGFIEFIKRVQVKRNDLLDNNIVKEINNTLNYYINEYPVEKNNKIIFEVVEKLGGSLLENHLVFQQPQRTF